MRRLRTYVSPTSPLGGNGSLRFYNALGKVDHTIDKFGNTNSFVYDAQGNTLQTTYPDGTLTQTVYDNNGRPIFTTDRNGTTGAPTQYDPAGRVLSTVRYLGAAVSLVADTSNPGQVTSLVATNGTPFSTNSTVYFANGWVQSRTGPDNQTTSYTYWPDGQIETVTDPLSDVTFYAYDDAGRRSQMRDANNHLTQFLYDAVGRSIATLFADNTYTSNYFNGVGQNIGQVDQANLTTQFGYDVWGQLTNVIKPTVLDPENNNNPVTPTWSYAFDKYERLSAIIDAKYRTNTFVYDAQGRQVSHWLPLGQMESNVYNNFGLIATQYDFKGQWTQFLYDHLGRTRAKYRFAVGASTPSEAVCYLYDPLGRVSQITQRYGEDATTNACDGYAFVVGQASSLSSLGPPGGFLSWVGRVTPCAPLLRGLARTPGDTAGFLTGLALCALGVLSLPYRMRRQLKTCALDALLARTRSSAASRAAAFRSRRLYLPSMLWRFVTYFVIVCLLGTDPRFDFFTLHAQCTTPWNPSTPTTRVTQFTYDFDGRVTQMNAPEGVINYTYDLPTGRLTSTCTANSQTAYTYDQLGRLSTVRVLARNGVALTNAEITTYMYDKVGNRSTVTLPSGVVTTYLYDSLNRLTNLTHQAGTTNLATYSYKLDRTGRRTNAVEVLLQEGGAGYLTNTLTWQYDGMYRLSNEISACSLVAGQYTNSYQYDKVGNRLKKIQIVGTTNYTTASSFDTNDELLVLTCNDMRYIV